MADPVVVNGKTIAAQAYGTNGVEWTVAFRHLISHLRSQSLVISATFEMQQEKATSRDEDKEAVSSAGIQDLILQKPITHAAAVITQKYATYRCNNNNDKYHAGIDISAPRGANVYPVLSGEVVKIFRIDPQRNENDWQKDNHCMGNVVIVKHADGKFALYAHLDNVLVGIGRIELGNALGTVGDTGYNSLARKSCWPKEPTGEPTEKLTGPHLHLEFKEEAVLNAPGSVNEWAYTSAFPDDVGYFNPEVEFDTPHFRSGDCPAR